MERNRTNKEEIILAEAAKLFHKKGYNATTMDEIAVAVGLSKASVFHYFGSKEEILYKITKPVLEIGVDLLCKTLESDITPKEKLQKALYDQLELIDQYFPGHFMLSEQDLNCVSSQMRKEMSPLMSRYVRLWREIIREGVNAGQFRIDLNIKLIAYSIVGMFSSLVNWYRKGDALSAEQIAEQYIALLTQGLLINDASGVPREQLCEVSKSESSARKDPPLT